MKNGKLSPPPPLHTLSKRPHSEKALLRKVFPDLLAFISEGNSIRAFLRQHSLSFATLHRALDASPEMREQYSHARRYQVESYVADIVPMSDAVIGEEMSVVTATRNAVDARKWVAGKLAPKEYGDAPSGVTINQNTNVLVVSEERLKQLQALRQQMLNPSAP